MKKAIVVLSMGFTMPNVALAWECATAACSTTCPEWSTRSVSYSVLNGDYTLAETGQIDEGANAWRATFGQTVRGAWFSWNIGPAHTSRSVGDGKNTVSDEADIVFQLSGISSTALAVAQLQYDGNTCSSAIEEVDVWFRESRTWVGGAPSEILSGERSRIQVAIHEFGHGLGLGHSPADHFNDELPTVMNSGYPNGGYLGLQARIHEDDADGLTALYPGSSTGANLALGKYHHDPADSTTSFYATDESWTKADIQQLDPDAIGVTNAIPRVCAGDSVSVGSPAGAGVPSAITTHYIGTGSESGVRLRWYWQPSSFDNTYVGECGDSSSIQWRSIVYNGITMDTQSTPEPSTWSVPSGTAFGYYTACAKIDATNSVSETSETDNVIYAEWPIRVPPPNETYCL